MARIGGHEVSKNTMINVSVGTVLAAIFTLWGFSGIGRPLFAADLKQIETKIDAYQTGTAVQILAIRKDALQSELRETKRYLRANPTDDRAADDVEEIEEDIDEINEKIKCHRTEGCEVEGDA